MDLQLLKNHLRVDHSFEDGLITQYKEWAEAEIKDSVSTEKDRNEDFFEENAHFERAVTLLTAYFYENRLAYDDVDWKEAPSAVLSAIQKLRGGYEPKPEEVVIVNVQSIEPL